METDNEFMKPERSRLSWTIFIGTAILFLSGCTPPAYHIIAVEKIGVLDNVVYVRASQDCNYCDDIPGHVYYASRDNGQTWDEITSPKKEILQSWEPDQNKQTPLCLPTDSNVCYRITDKEQVDISYDGGIAWQSDWQIPAGRKYYMQRRALYYPAPDTTPFDMKAIESNTGHFVVVAMGNQGVLVKSPNGNWERIAVGLAVPTPYQAANLSEAGDVLFSEQIAAILISIVCLAFLSIAVWITAYVNSDSAVRNNILRSCLPIIFFTAASAIFLLNSIYIAFVLPLVGFLITWLAVFVVLSKKFLGFLTFVLSVGFSILLYFCIMFPFQLWALGYISVYETAQVIILVLGVIVLFVAAIAEIRITVRLAGQSRN